MNISDIMLVLVYCLATVVIFAVMAAIPVAPPVRIRAKDHRGGGPDVH